nr:M14 family zinc carboxypeptidase [Nocardioides perillae]
MAASDRVSVQVVGQSTQGRDLYLVTVTAPETTAETAQQTAWREQIKADPAAAAGDEALAAGYKTPVWISNNIHGNEWEGTDAAMQYIEELATSTDPAVLDMLRTTRLYFSPTLNPDGRTLGNRATALGLDPNRDVITNQTPETKSFVRVAQAIQAVYAADFHGYTRVLQVEPCGPPHGSNYEYDVYLPHNYALALKVEQDVTAANISGNTYYDPASPTGTTLVNNGKIKIPYRDTPSGWDDFPPIFTAQYAAYYGAASATVELPLPRTGTRQTAVTAPINTEVAYETMKSMLGYMAVPANAREMVQNQIEVFRRGAAGEPKVSLTTENINRVTEGPTQWKEHWDEADDQEPVVLPRAYVIPVGGGQRSDSDARALVEQLLFHEVEVGTLDRATTVGGTTYPAGSYVVDMHQAKRGLANALLDLGDDISDKVPTMYDISAWSLAELWGADVAKVGSTSDVEPVGPTTPVTTVRPGTAPRQQRHLAFPVAGLPDFQALNALLEEGIAVSLLEDGTAVVAPRATAKARELATTYGVDFRPATGRETAALRDESTKGLRDLRIGWTGTQDDLLSLTELGFDDLVRLDPATVDAATLDGVDVIWVGGTFAPAEGSAARTAVQEWLDEGGAITGRGAGAFASAASFGLVSGTAVTGRRDGNGIVAVDTPAAGVLGDFPQDRSFIYPATWFDGLGEGTTAEQSYDAEDPFLAGHWLPNDGATDGAGGPQAAAGKAAAVSGVDEETGAKAFVFGTSVFFRTHPKGMLSQAGTALLWAGPEARGVQAPRAASKVRVRADRAGQVRRGEGPVRITVTYRVPPRAGVGTVNVFDDGELLRRVRIDEADRGVESFTVRLERGVHRIAVRFPGDGDTKGSWARTRVRVR